MLDLRRKVLGVRMVEKMVRKVKFTLKKSIQQRGVDCECAGRELKAKYKEVY